MGAEEKIKQELEDKFSYLKDKVTVKRARRIFADVPLDNFKEVFEHAVKSMEFSGLSTITGLDNVSDFQVIYHLNRKDGVVLNLRVPVGKENPSVKTITKYFPGAESYEREIADLLGIKIEGLADGYRYPLPEDWPKGEYPLRKDWKGSFLKEGREAQNA